MVFARRLFGHLHTPLVRARSRVGRGGRVRVPGIRRPNLAAPWLYSIGVYACRNRSTLLLSSGTSYPRPVRRIVSAKGVPRWPTRCACFPWSLKSKGF